jgi:hypothetical protein
VNVHGNSISQDAGSGILVENASKVLATENNIFSNQGFGINNLEPTISINATNNWWGDASGPSGSGPGSGDKVSGGVIFSNWLTEMVSLVTSAERDTIIMPIGEIDTVNMYFQNWENLDDMVNVEVGDNQGWLQSPISFSVSLNDSLGAVVPLTFAVLQATSNGAENYVEVISTSQSNTDDIDTVNFLIIAEEAEMIAVSVYPDSVAILPGDSISFEAIGIDQFYRSREITPEWSCTGGTISNNGY